MNINSTDTTTHGRVRLTVREMAIFSMLGALMFTSKIVMELLPNVHLLGVLTIVYTLTYRVKALIPIYIYVIMNGVYAGFNFWWMPYLYIWTVLWAVVMLLPRGKGRLTSYVIYPSVCAAHGLLFGILYAPAQALAYGLDFHGTLAWIAAGIPFDVMHGVSNFCIGFLIAPLYMLLLRLDRKTVR